jgi:hypothetical protein
MCGWRRQILGRADAKNRQCPRCTSSITEIMDDADNLGVAAGSWALYLSLLAVALVVLATAAMCALGFVVMYLLG